MRQGCPLFPLLFNSTRISSQRNKAREIKGIQIGKAKVKLSLFAGDMILYLKDPTGFMKNLLDLINTFGNVARNKIDIQK
jgi:hypothetical protein